MASNASAASFKTLSSSLDAVAQSLLSQHTQIPSKQYNSLCTALVHVRLATSTLLDWNSASQSPKTSAAANLVMQAHCSSITSYAAFAQASLAWMHNITPDPSMHHKTQATKPLFDIMFTPMVVVTFLPSSWPTARYLHRNPQLYNTLSALAAYFLSRKRKANSAMDVTITAHHVMTPALLLVQTTSMCLRPVFDSVDCNLLASLPRGFINNICCLACEQLGQFLSSQDALLARRGHWVELSNLLFQIIHGVEQASGTADHQRCCNVLLGQGTLEASRMVKCAYCCVALCGERGTSRAGSDLVKLMSWCGSLSRIHEPIEELYTQSSAQTKHTSGRENHRGHNQLAAHHLASSSRSRCNIDVGITEPLYTPRVKVTDAQLTAALSQQSRHTPSSLNENNQLINIVWLSANVGRARSSNPLNDSGNADAALGIADHCSFHVLLWMREDKRRQEEQVHRQLGQENRRGSLQFPVGLHASTVRETKLGIVDLRGLINCSSTNWTEKELPGCSSVLENSVLDLQAEARFHVWQSMPGSMMMLEALLREESFVINAKQLLYALIAAKQLLFKASPPCLPACVSLFSTIRKHTGMFVKKLAAQAKLERRRGEADEGWGKDVEDALGEVPKCLSSLLKSTLVCKDRGGNVGSSTCSSNGGSSSSFKRGGTSYKDGTRVTYEYLQDFEHTNSVPPSTSLILLNSNAQSFKAMEQLRALLTLTLTHLRGLTAWTNLVTANPQPQWCRDVLPQLDPFLASIVGAVNTLHVGSLDGTQELGYFRMTDIFWEHYTQWNFRGRLLSGCCHLRCRNMEGCSEAALPTLLCSGCRRVRYCSVACQKAAWATGGHSFRCGTNSFGEAKLDNSGKWFAVMPE